MTYEGAIELLLAAVAGDPASEAALGTDSLAEWPIEAVAAMKKQGLLRRASPAKSVVCYGCEEECVMPVETQARADGATASFVACDKRDDISRVSVSAGRLHRWRCDLSGIGRFISEELDLRSSKGMVNDPDLYEVGIAAGKKRMQMLCLRAKGQLDLVVGGESLPLAELVRFSEDGYVLDRPAVTGLVDAASTTDPRYTASTARREVGKHETKVRHAAWRKAYLQFKKKRPNMPDTWYSKRIAEMPVADGRTAATICRHMK